MTTPASDPTHAALQQAAMWYATLLDAAPDAADHARWRAWVKNPQNARAWAQVEAVSRQFQPLRGNDQRLAADAALKAARRPHHSRRRVLAGLASFGTLGLLGWHAPLLRQQWQTHTADLRTGTGELRETPLVDGTHLWMAPGTAVDLDYGPTQRRLYLYTGQIHVATASDRQRRFVVQTPLGTLQALGTRFSVRLLRDTLHLVVQEGAVEMQLADTRRIVRAGQQVRATAGAIGDTTLASPQADAWTRGLLVADQMPLGELVAELSRYRYGHLGIDPEIAHLPVVGVFPLRDTDAALALLTRSLPVRVAQPLRWWTSLEPAPASTPR